ncbi:MAG: tyrosine-type recombinase/integrase [Acidimicrobiales bacterium]
MPPFAEEWRSSRRHSANTRISVEQHLRRHIYPVIGDRPIGAIRHSEIQGLVTHLSKSLSASTVRVIYSRVVAIFRTAVRDRVIQSSPCIGISLPERQAQVVDQVLLTEDVLGIADAILPRYRALIITGAGTGLRPGELFGLTLDCVDFRRGAVRVEKQLVRVKGEGVALGPLKTRQSQRTVPLPNIVRDALAAHLSSWPVCGGLNLVFTNSRGNAVQESPFGTVWRTARTKAGAGTWATPHDLRHYYASQLIHAGESVKVVQGRLGHSSAKTTLDTYGHMFPESAERTRSAIDHAFSEATCGLNVAFLGLEPTNSQVSA